MFLVRAAALAAVACLCGTAAAAVDLVPHRAVYTMSLKSTRPASGISGASGSMTYEFGDACDGWTVNNKTVLNLVYNEGGQIRTTWDFITWEAKDGLSYRFHVRSMRDGEVTEEIDGRATLEGRGKGGLARFVLPESKAIPLPRGTLFPTEHTQRVLERARDSDRFVSRVVFDGSGEEGPFEVNAVVARKLEAGTPTQAPETPLTRVPSWRIQLAFFPLESSDPIPDYEVGVRYFLNGVASEVIQDFGSFSLRGRLEKIEPLPKPDC